MPAQQEQVMVSSSSLGWTVNGAKASLPWIDRDMDRAFGRLAADHVQRRVEVVEAKQMRRHQLERQFLARHQAQRHFDRVVAVAAQTAQGELIDDHPMRVE